MNLVKIATVECSLKEKFGVPKQSQMNELISKLNIEPNIPMESFVGLEDMSHIWIIFGFHQNKTQTAASVRPPLLGGNKRVGLYSSRSSFRHNNLGLSLVEIIKLNFDEHFIEVKGLDCVNETPVFDIKPFHPVADIPNVEPRLGWIKETLKKKELLVTFQCNPHEKLKQKIIEVLKFDPRPSYHHDVERVYGILIDDYNVRWKIDDFQKIIVLSVEKV